MSVQNMALPDQHTPPVVARTALLGRVARKAEAVGRCAQDITLVAVSKRQPLRRLEAVLEAGHRIFGENFLKEALERWLPLREHYHDIELRFIGKLQTNKAALAVQHCDVIETLDRDRLARALADAAQKQGRLPRLYVQVNTGEEPQKSGIVPYELDAFLARMRTDYDLTPEGLMIIPPVHEAPSLHFTLLAKLARRNGLEKLSMGMSGDFETAIASGATSIRLGTALFGPRQEK